MFRGNHINDDNIEPIIKSRDIDFIVGFFSSRVYVLSAPKLDIIMPPINIPNSQYPMFWMKLRKKRILLNENYSSDSNSIGSLSISFISSPNSSNDVSCKLSSVS